MSAGLVVFLAAWGWVAAFGLAWRVVRYDRQCRRLLALLDRVTSMLEARRAGYVLTEEGVHKMLAQCARELPPERRGL